MAKYESFNLNLWYKLKKTVTYSHHILFGMT